MTHRLRHHLLDKDISHPSEAADAVYPAGTLDEVLRPTETRLKVNSSELETISKLEYTPFDQVEVKWLGEKLQKIDYLYDAAGRLTHINTIGESECYRDVAFCQYSLAFSVFENDSTVIWTCRYASGIEINGLSYPFPNALDLLNPDSIAKLEGYLAAALDASGYQGEVSLISFPFSGGYSFHIVITSSDAPDLALNFQFCGLQYDFVQEDCCEKNPPPPPAGVAAGLLPHNDDLFYEEITYNGLDISRIEIGSDCSLGYMRNDFSYDTNHRVTRMLNTFFNPDPIAGRYNTSYKYDAAGNITRLNRYGLVDASAGQYTYGLIDSLVYTYDNGDSRLSAIEDFVPDPLAEPKGFEIAGAFGYDGNGNFTSDGDQGLAIVSNLINLPRIVASPVDSLLFEYTFGGEKIRKLQTSPVARERIYLGGAEFVNDTLELYHHAEGRVVWRDTTPAFQYRIADHLGNTVVFFEDRDGDTKIKTEPMTSDPDSLEVLQRNYYYPFGMEMEGPWQAATAPRADYLYNGKELEEDLGLDWYAYGFRYYDASIGRFTGVDPIGEQFAELSVFNYASNDPVRMIDLHGLQGEVKQDQHLGNSNSKLSFEKLRGHDTPSAVGSFFKGAWDGFQELGRWIKDAMPEGGTPDASDYEDENYTHKGSGVETFADTPVPGNGTQALPNAEEGASTTLSENEVAGALKPGEAGGSGYDLAQKLAGIKFISNVGVGLGKGKDAVDMAQENRPKPRLFSLITNQSGVF